MHKLIDFALIEVLRSTYLQKHFQHLQNQAKLPAGAKILSRPPEERDLKNQTATVIYPDPPLGSEEQFELAQYHIPLLTPTTYFGSSLQGLSIGISISKPDENELQVLGLSQAHLQNAMLEIARQCLVKGATLVYGGDLRKDGFTENLLDLVRYHNDAINKQIKPAINFLAWPLRSTVDAAWQAQHKDALKIKHVDPPDDLMKVGLITTNSIPDPKQTPPTYIWARCLTTMRQQIVQQTQARIMMGGRSTGYKGIYPGLVEEALISLKAQKPLFLLGGFGGVTRAIIQAMQGLQTELLTLAYQCKNPDYSQFMQDYNRSIKQQELNLDPIDYPALIQRFADFSVGGLNNGLTEDENQTLFASINHEETIALMLTGLGRLTSK